MGTKKKVPRKELFCLMLAAGQPVSGKGVPDFWKPIEDWKLD
jgi:hypothetical protein